MAKLVPIHPIIIPDGVRLRRAPRSNLRTSDGLPLSDGDLAQYDQDTIFFDVFFDPTNRYLQAVGPPLVNLKARLLPIEVVVNEAALPASLEEFSFRRFIHLSAPLEPKVAAAENDVWIRFGDTLEWRETIPRNLYGSHRGLTLATQQKDNRLRWVQDYVRYYRNVHGVERFILYDNGSSYQEELVHLFPDDVFIIHWPFEHGPIHSHGNKFGQVGSMTHAIYRFGNDGYCLNFDVDELLVIRGKRRIVDYLRNYSIVRVDQYRVPYIEPGTADYSFQHFPKREAELDESMPKYAYKFSDVGLAHWHDAVLREDRWLFRVMTFVYRLNYWLRAKLDLPQYRSPSRLSRVFERGLDWIGRRSKTRYRLDESEGYFLHFRGITTEWKRELTDRLRPPEDESRLVEDEYLVRYFSRANED